MSHSAIQDRLRDHAKAFDGLLSLIPAKIYYGEDNSSQWSRKKQTKAEAAAARRGKLDPDSELNRNAKEVMDQRAKSKPRSGQQLRHDGSPPGGDEGGDGHLDGMDGIAKETPGQGLKRKAATATAEPKKKRKVDRELSGNDAVNAEGEVQGETGGQLSASGEKNPAGGERKKRQRKRPKKEPKRAAREKTEAAETAAGDAASNPTLMAEPSSSAPKHPTSVRDPPSKPGADKPHRRKLAAASAPDEPSPDKPSPDGTGLPKHGAPDEQPTGAASDPGRAQVPSIVDQPQSADQAKPTTASPNHLPNDHASPAGLPEALVSAASEEKPRLLKIPADTTALRARLAAKIEALRAARKADGTDGRPIRTRQELIESRRAKQAQLKAHKKELRRQAKLEEDRVREEALASNSPMSASPSLGPEQDGPAANFSFNRVAFSDGTRLSHDLSYALNRDGTAAAKKGPSDPKTALLKIQNQKKRLDGLDEEKRKEIGEKEAWLTARRRAEGAKIHDDEAMLKKVVKRKEHAKKKTEREWKERSRGVDHAMKERQRKRDENLQKRKDEKALGKMGRGKAKGARPAKKGGRPGFEGGFKFGASKKK